MTPAEIHALAAHLRASGMGYTRDAVEALREVAAARPTHAPALTDEACRLDRMGSAHLSRAAWLLELAAGEEGP